jgi:hypothetical protein
MGWTEIVVTSERKKPGVAILLHRAPIRLHRPAASVTVVLILTL